MRDRKLESDPTVEKLSDDELDESVGGSDVVHQVVDQVGDEMEEKGLPRPPRF
jgi:hypothetical protein